MPRTQVRASQFKSKDITDIQLAAGAVFGTSANKGGIAGIIKQGTISTPDMRDGAVTPSKIAAAPVVIASVGGILTLTDDTSYFLVNGGESLTNITGWTSGTVRVEWQTDRTLVHTGGVLELTTGGNRAVYAGDISTFVFKAGGLVREVSYLPKTQLNEQPYVTEQIAAAGQTIIALGTTPINKDYITLTINGITQLGMNYSLSGNTITLSQALYGGEEIRAVAYNRAIVQALAGGSTNVYDGGSF